MSKPSTSCTRKKLRPRVQGKPLRRNGDTAPSRSSISRLRREMQAARLPSHTESSASTTTLRIAPVPKAGGGGPPYRPSAYDKHLVTFGFVADLVKRWQGWLEAPVFEGSNFFKWHLRPAQIHRLAGRIVLAWQCENVIINQDMKTRNETDRASKAGS